MPASECEFIFFFFFFQKYIYLLKSPQSPTISRTFSPSSPLSSHSTQPTYGETCACVFCTQAAAQVYEFPVGSSAAAED